MRKIGLSLSGGGYRASAFHLGTLRKLNELGVLSQIQIMSTISGGSITGAAYCLHKGSYKDFEDNMIRSLSTKNVIRYILTSFTFVKALLFVFTFFIIIILSFYKGLYILAIIVFIILLYLIIRYQFKIFPVSNEIISAYNKFFFNNATLSDLNDFPELAIGSTNLQTARPFTFSKRKMEDSYYAYLNPPIKFNTKAFPIANAVAASSCVPFAFTPINISRRFFKNEADFDKINPKLVDGGIYDNQGIQKLTQPGSSYECNIVITSDAGNKLPFEGLYNNTIVLLIRTVDVFMTRIKNFQMAQQLFELTNTSSKEIAYLSLGWDLEQCIPGFIRNLKTGNMPNQVITDHGIPEDWVNNVSNFEKDILKILEVQTNFEQIRLKSLSPVELKNARNVSTSLTPLSLQTIGRLITHAENLTELQVKLYCPSLFKTN